MIQSALSKGCGQAAEVQDGERWRAVRPRPCRGRRAADGASNGAERAQPCAWPIPRAAHAGEFGAEIRTVIDHERSQLRGTEEFMGNFNLQDMLAQARQQAEKLQEKMQQITVDAPPAAAA